jgi:hypothetical protein
MYSQCIQMYLNIFKCIWTCLQYISCILIYSFKCFYRISQCIQMYLNVFIIYFNALSMYSNVFECIQMYLNVFKYIYVPIGPF